MNESNTYNSRSPERNDMETKATEKDDLHSASSNYTSDISQQHHHLLQNNHDENLTRSMKSSSPISDIDVNKSSALTAYGTSSTHTSTSFTPSSMSTTSAIAISSNYWRQHNAGIVGLTAHGNGTNFKSANPLLSSSASTSHAFPSAASHSKNKPLDDLKQMQVRASENKCFIYIKVPGVQHCLSYKARMIY